MNLENSADDLSVATAIVDLQGNVVDVNIAFSKISGLTLRKLAGTKFSSLLHDEDRASFQRDFIRHINDHSRPHISNCRLSINGVTLSCCLLQSMTFDASSSRMRMKINVIEWTGDGMMDGIQNWLDLDGNTDEGIAIADPEGNRLKLVSHFFAQIHGYTPKELVGTPLSCLLSDNAAAVPYRRTNLSDHSNYVARHKRKDGSEFSPAIEVSLIRDASGEILWRQLRVKSIDSKTVMRQHALTPKNEVMALQTAEQRLIESRTLLRNLIARRDADIEKERHHIAREIHDDLGQVLTAMRIKTDLCQLKFASANPQLAAMIGDIAQLIEQAFQTTRNIGSSLRPPTLDMGLTAAIEWQAQNFSITAGVPCTLSIREDDIDLDDERAVAVFRIVQESLTNISRHANARHAEIVLYRHGSNYELMVSDDGDGFDTEGPYKENSFGLIGIRERCHVLGGRFTIVSSPGAGTAVNVQFPHSLSQRRGIQARES